MNPVPTSILNTTLKQLVILFSIVILLSSCSVEKKYDQILTSSAHDTLAKQINYNAVKSIGSIKEIKNDALAFDQYIANDFRFPKKKEDSAAIINYFVKESFAQLGRREFRQWDVVVIRGVLFQINLEKKPDFERPLIHNRPKIELIGMLFLLLGVYFFN